jgi:3-deoxy-7-phosphoheptulonate synthase
MHGNGITTASGLKTRDFDQILREIERSFDVHAALGSILGGVHFELTGEDVTECIGGGIRESDLDRNYLSVCDPRLNYAQGLEMAFLLGRRLNGRVGPSPSTPPPAQ